MISCLTETCNMDTIDFKGFAAPPSDPSIFFSAVTTNDENLLCCMDVELSSGLETFMGNLQARVTIDDVYANANLRELERQCITNFQQLPVYTKQDVRPLFYNDLITLKLKVKKTGDWVFTTNDKQFTPTKPLKMVAGAKFTVVFTPGFYYSDTHCGVYMTLKTVNFAKPTKSVKK